MKSARRFKLIVRWSLVTAGAIALFWAVWNRATGSVPLVTSITIIPDWIIQLPFGISRWWDILIGPIWSTIIVLIMTSKTWEDEDGRYEDPFPDIKDVDEMPHFQTVALIVGTICGLFTGLVGGLLDALYVSLGFALGLNLLIVLVEGNLRPGAIAGLSTALGTALVAGLVAGLIVTLFVALVTGLGFLIKWGYSRGFWKAIKDWLLVSDAKK